MILVIDTSSAMAALAILGPGGRVESELLLPSRSNDLRPAMRALASVHVLSKVAVATGPGSFTGLRVGVSFGLGLAIGLGVPIIPLPTLGIQAARSDEPVLAVAEAGRGRVYYMTPDGRATLGEPAGLPTDHELVGWVTPQTERSLLAVGLRFRPPERLRTFGGAAARLLETANEVAYGSLEIEYMQSFLASSR